MTRTSTPQFELPEERQADMRRAKRLAWISIFYMFSVIGLMYLVMGSSQAMKTAWVEDILSLIPPIGFLIAARVRYRAPSDHYPYGYFRSINIAYFTSAIALTAMGASLLQADSRVAAAATVSAREIVMCMVLSSVRPGAAGGPPGAVWVKRAPWEARNPLELAHAPSPG